MNIGWFSTGRDEAARDLFITIENHIKTGDIKGQIIFTFCNREPEESKNSDQFIELIKQSDVPLITLSSNHFFEKLKIADVVKRRAEFDKAVLTKINNFHPDICILAGYMLIISAEMCNKLDMINLHPALPNGPKGSWQEVIWELIEQRARSTGVMMHLVTPDLDRGPVITYCSFPIKGADFDKYWDEINNSNVSEIKTREGENNNLFKTIRHYGLLREFPLIIFTLRALCNGDIRITRKQLYDRQGNRLKGYDLTSEVNNSLKCQ